MPCATRDAGPVSRDPLCGPAPPGQSPARPVDRGLPARPARQRGAPPGRLRGTAVPRGQIRPWRSRLPPTSFMAHSRKPAAPLALSFLHVRKHTSARVRHGAALGVSPTPPKSSGRWSGLSPTRFGRAETTRFAARPTRVAKRIQRVEVNAFHLACWSRSQDLRGGFLVFLRQVHWHDCADFQRECNLIGYNWSRLHFTWNSTKQYSAGGAGRPQHAFAKRTQRVEVNSSFAAAFPEAGT